MASATTKRRTVTVFVSAALVVVALSVYALLRSAILALFRADSFASDDAEEDLFVASSRVEGRNSNGDRVIHYGRAFVNSESTECYFIGAPEAEWETLMFTFGGFDFIVRCQLETNNNQNFSVVCCPAQFELDILE